MSEVRFHEMPDGRRIAFRHTAGDGPTLVFLPGYMSDMAGGKATSGVGASTPKLKKKGASGSDAAGEKKDAKADTGAVSVSGLMSTYRDPIYNRSSRVEARNTAVERLDHRLHVLECRLAVPKPIPLDPVSIHPRAARVKRRNTATLA